MQPTFLTSPLECLYYALCEIYSNTVTGEKRFLKIIACPLRLRAYELFVFSYSHQT